jgi:hypothetical protein
MFAANLPAFILISLSYKSVTAKIFLISIGGRNRPVQSGNLFKWFNTKEKRKRDKKSIALNFRLRGDDR